MCLHCVVCCTLVVMDVMEFHQLNGIVIVVLTEGMSFHLYDHNK